MAYPQAESHSGAKQEHAFRSLAPGHASSIQAFPPDYRCLMVYHAPKLVVKSQSLGSGTRLVVVGRGEVTSFNPSGPTAREVMKKS